MVIKVVFFLLLFIECFAACSAQKAANGRTKNIDTAYTFKKASADGIGKYYKQREIAQVMGAAGSSWLERDERQQEENTQLAIENIELAPNGVVADIGAGTGYYSFKLAPKVPNGKVYAVELQDEMIRYLKNKKAALKDSIVEIVKGTDHSPNLPNNSIDLAIMVDVYHELEFPSEMLRAIGQALKSNGMILLIEYRGEEPAIPIKALHKTSVVQLNKELNANGFELYYKGEFLPIQHFLLYKKK